MKLHKEKEQVVDVRLISVLQSVTYAKRQAAIQVVEFYISTAENSVTCLCMVINMH
jgi:hypothetical protein